MSAHDAIIAVVREWLALADNDLLNASHTLKLGKICPTETVTFHAQQAVEKHIKALLVYHDIPFPKSHNIGVVRALLPAKLRPKLTRAVQKRLTGYAVQTRYPNTSAVSLAESRKAV